MLKYIGQVSGVLEVSEIPVRGGFGGKWGGAGEGDLSLNLKYIMLPL